MIDIADKLNNEPINVGFVTLYFYQIIFFKIAFIFMYQHHQNLKKIFKIIKFKIKWRIMNLYAK